MNGRNKQLQWNSVNTVTNGPKKFGRINEGFFLRENVWRFLLGGQKNGRNNEATVLPRSRPGRWKAEDLTGPDHHINNFQSP